MLEDHIGKVYNRWTVLGLGGKVRGKQQLNCQCICGNIKDVRPERVIHAKSSNCRCKTEIKPGDKFERLTLIKRAPDTSSHSARWECLCDCGNTCVVFQTNFTRGLSKSCGCFAVETRTTHGMSQSKTYDIWVAIKQRTTDPNIAIAHHYIDRGKDHLRFVVRV